LLGGVSGSVNGHGTFGGSGNQFGLPCWPWGTSNAGCGLLSNDSFLLFGGFTTDSNMNQLWRYDPVSLQFLWVNGNNSYGPTSIIFDNSTGR